MYLCHSYRKEFSLCDFPDFSLLTLFSYHIYCYLKICYCRASAMYWDAKMRKGPVVVFFLLLVGLHSVLVQLDAVESK